jgi:hypothetical protein
MKDAFGIDRADISKALPYVDQNSNVYNTKGQKVKSGQNDKYLRSKGELKAVQSQQKKDLKLHAATLAAGAGGLGAGMYSVYQVGNKGDKIANLRRARTANKIGVPLVAAGLAGSMATSARENKAANTWRAEQGLKPRNAFTGKPKS